MAAMLMGAWSLQSCDNEPTKEVWLDEFGQDSCYVQDWGMELFMNVDLVPIPSAACCTIWMERPFLSPVWQELMTRTCLQANFSSRFSVTRRNSGRVE